MSQQAAAAAAAAADRVQRDCQQSDVETFQCSHSCKAIDDTVVSMHAW